MGESWKQGCSLSVYQGTLEMHIFEGSPLWTLLGMMKSRALTYPDLKIPCKGLSRLSFISFWFARRDQWSYESKAARLTLMKWYQVVVCSDILSWCFQLSKPWQLQSPRKFTSLQDCVNSSEGTRQWLQKSLSVMNKKDANALSAFVDGTLWMVKIPLAN